MKTNAYHPEPVLWRKSPLPHHATWWSSVSGEAAIEFGRFRVLLRRRRLLADGAPVELGTRAFDLLLALLEADGALVTKKELLNQVWPSVVVSKENLKVHVSALRKALGADRDLIRTEFGPATDSSACCARIPLPSAERCRRTRRATDGTSYLQCDRVVITGIENSAYAFLEGIAHGAQLEEAIRAARRIAPSFDSSATLDFLFAEGLIVGVQ